MNWIENLPGMRVAFWAPRRPDAPVVLRDPWTALSLKAYRSRMNSFGSCSRCLVPWSLVKGHSTDYCPHEPGAHALEGASFLVDDVWIPAEQYVMRCKGAFPLCEGCWSALTPRERFPYYLQLIDEWVGEHEKTRAQNIQRYDEARVDGWLRDIQETIPSLLEAVVEGR